MFEPLNSLNGPDVRLIGLSDEVETSEGRMAKLVLGFTNCAKAWPWPT